MADRSLGRRRFLAGLVAGGGALLLAPGALGGQQPAPARPRAGGGEDGELFNPDVVGRSRERTSALDNAEAIKQVELRLACTCPCSLDIFTCRTTDFTCTYSPALHREIVGMWDRGMTAQQIIDAFVAKYGEEILMAPKPQGFNLAGYVVPGLAVTAAGGLLVWYLRRRGAALAPASAGGGAPALDAGATPEELARLQRALAEADD